MLKTRLIPWMFGLTLVSVGGCVHRTITVRSDPPDALVYLNDQEVGRTPFTREFTWYGTYDVEVRKEGYQSIKTTAMVWAPWWQWVPFDLITEALPLEDHHDLNYKLVPPSPRQTDPELLLRRGEQMQGQLMSSEKPTTQPTTKPTTKPAKRVKRK
jgi:PEGA domain-containing protein